VRITTYDFDQFDGLAPFVSLQGELRDLDARSSK
jgi:hypothetical protein